MRNATICEINSDFAKYYRDNGYIILRNIISKKSLVRLQNDLILYLAKLYPEVKDALSFNTKIIDLHKTDSVSLHKFQIAATRLSSFYSIIAEIHDCLVKITPGSSDLFHTGLGFVLGIPDSQRLAYDWHQDGTYHEGTNRTNIHAWFPIFYPVSFENGAMSLVENSHKSGLLDFEKFKFQSNGYTTNKVSSMEVVLKTHREFVCAMDVGDCMFFCDELIHKSNINRTHLCRIAGVMKYSLDPSYDVNSGLVGV